MKVTQKDSEKVGWDQMRNPSGPPISSGSQNRILPKFMVWLILFVLVSYVVYTLKLVSSSSRACDDDPLFTTSRSRFVLRQSQPNKTSSSSESPPPIHE